MGIWGRPKSDKDAGIYITCSKKTFLAWKEFVIYLMNEKKKNISYEEALIELLKYHPKGLELVKKYNLEKPKDSLWM